MIVITRHTFVQLEQPKRHAKDVRRELPQTLTNPWAALWAAEVLKRFGW